MIKNSEKLKLGVDLTINFRAADFSFKQGVQFGRNYKRGFVPVINTYLHHEIVKWWALLIDGDFFLR